MTTSQATTESLAKTIIEWAKEYEVPPVAIFELVEKIARVKGSQSFIATIQQLRVKVFDLLNPYKV